MGGSGAPILDVDFFLNGNVACLWISLIFLMAHFEFPKWLCCMSRYFSHVACQQALCIM